MSQNDQNRHAKDPDIEEQITAAFETLSDKDKELFEDTQLIHTDRDVSVETQMHHVINLHKKHQRKRRIVFITILVLLVIGIAASVFGIYAMRQRRAEEANAEVQTTTEPDVEVEINAINFPDTAFRERIITPADTNGDGILSSDEIASVIMINMADDERLSDLTGIQYLTSLQSIDISHTNVQSADLSANTEITYLSVAGDSLSTLDLSHNIKLTSLNISDSSLQQVILPEPSMITSVVSDNTAFQCHKNDEGIYTACQLISVN